MGSMMALRIELQDAAGPMKIVQVPLSCLFQSIPNLQMMALKCSAKVFFYFCLRCLCFVFVCFVFFVFGRAVFSGAAHTRRIGVAWGQGPKSTQGPFRCVFGEPTKAFIFIAFSSSK